MQVLGMLPQTTANTPQPLLTSQQPPCFPGPSFILIFAFLLIGLLLSGDPPGYTSSSHGADVWLYLVELLLVFGRRSVQPPRATGIPSNQMASWASSSPSDRRVALDMGGQLGALASRGRHSGEAAKMGVAFLRFSHGGLWRVAEGASTGGGDGVRGSHDS